MRDEHCPYFIGDPEDEDCDGDYLSGKINEDD